MDKSCDTITDLEGQVPLCAPDVHTYYFKFCIYTFYISIFSTKTHSSFKAI